MKTPREVAEDVLAQEPWALALWDREAAIALVVEAVEQSRREVAALIEPKVSQEFEVGDWVELTGEKWADMRGRVVQVRWIQPNDLVSGEPLAPAFGDKRYPYFIFQDGTYDYSATKVED